MRTTISDLAGLNQTDVAAMPIIGSEADVQSVWDRLAAQPGLRASLAGMRCSQGGHTALDGAEMLLMEGFNRPIDVDRGGYNPAKPREIDQHTPNVTVSAGATWSEVHHAVKGHGLACLVHQSSPHFTVGGGLSVNCHGRDPRQGPLSSTVNWVEVWTPAGVQRTSPTENPELFKAVLGGYGSCGPILRANLKLGANLLLEQNGYKSSPQKYGDHLVKLANRDPALSKIHLHYGWLQCLAPDDLFNEILSVDYLDEDMPTAAVDRELKIEDWGDTELLRAAWAAARLGDPALRQSVWNLLATELESGTDSRLNWMRASISFTSHRGKSETDILQEYFVPVERFNEMRLALKGIFAAAHVNVLSATVRLVQQDLLPVNLSYCPERAMACIAVDVSVPVEGTPRVPGSDVKTWVNQAVDAAVALGGTFYLPYFRFVERGRFREIYANWTLQRDAINLHNNGRRWSNAFVEDYFR